jgi:regulator of protease activity HflC (stomatin/prohibitin superfamily)
LCFHAFARWKFQCLRHKWSFEQGVEEARGAAESVKLAAPAEAEAMRARAEAEAQDQEILAKVGSRDVILLRAIEKWDGVMPRVASEAVPMLNLRDEDTK